MMFIAGFLITILLWLVVESNVYERDTTGSWQAAGLVAHIIAVCLMLYSFLTFAWRNLP